MTRPFHQRGVAAAGFTLIELITASAIFVVVTTIALAAYVNVFSANRSTDAERLLTDESSYLLETLTKQLRNSVIDYPEYWRWGRADGDPPDPDEVLDDYVRYVEQNPGSFEGSAALPTDERQLQTPAAPSPGLVLLSPDGNRRLRIWQSFVQRRPASGGDLVEEGVLTVAYEQLVVTDSGTPDDAADDSWYWIDSDAPDTCTSGNPTSPFCTPVAHALSSEKLDVTGFTFTITPSRDPFFAFDDDTVQVQPHVRLRLTLALSVTVPTQRAVPPHIALQTSSSIRSYGLVAWLNPTPLP